MSHDHQSQLDLLRSLQRHNLKNAAYQILLTLTKGPSTMTNLSVEIETSTANATGLVERLVQQGYVERVAREGGDRRSVIVRLTERGRQIIGAIQNYQTQSA